MPNLAACPNPVTIVRETEAQIPAGEVYGSVT